MADWDTSRLDYTNSATKNAHSRESSHGSQFSGSSKNSNSCNDSNVDDSSQRMLILNEGSYLASESRTEMPESNAATRQPFTAGSGYGTAKAKAAKSPFTAPPIDTVPVEEITVPNDANLSAFTSAQLASFLRYLKVDDRIISHLYRKSIDGKRFGKMTESELDTLGMNNPVIIFFKNKSSVKSKKKGPFML